MEINTFPLIQMNLKLFGWVQIVQLLESYVKFKFLSLPKLAAVT